MFFLQSNSANGNMHTYKALNWTLKQTLDLWNFNKYFYSLFFLIHDKTHYKARLLKYINHNYDNLKKVVIEADLATTWACPVVVISKRDLR